MKWKDPFYSRPSVYDTFNILSGEQEGFDFSNPKICYGGKGGGSSNAGTSTSTVTNTPPPEVLAAYQKALGMADTASSAPLQQYQGSTVAGFTPDQMQAFGTINNAQGTAQPYIDQATGLINQSNASLWNGAQKFSPDAISQYQNPYTQQVLNSQIGLEQNQDAMQQQALKGNAISSGAWGGDRAGVASAVLSGQQALANNSTNANILNTGYNQALGEFNQQQGAQLSADTANAQLAQQGAFGLGQLGTQALGTQLQGASSQLQSGALQQQLAQEQLNVPYQQFLQQQAYPFQTGQYYANIAEGIGSNSGGTGTTTTTGPQPSTASQLGGLGLGGLGLLGGLFGGSASGGRVFRRGGSVPRFASGGPSSYSATGVPDLSTNFIPETQGAHGSGPPTAAAIARAVEAAQNSGTNPQSLAGAGKGLSGLMSLFGGSGGGSGNVAGFDSLMQQLGGSASGDQAASDYINSSAGDQVASDVAAEDAAGSGDYFSGLFDWFNKGGKVKGAMGTRRGYADGGSTEHNNEWMSTIGNWIGTIIGSVYGGPAGGFVGSKAGSDAGGTLGDLFAGDWDQTGSDLEATVQGGLNPSIGGMGGNFSNTSKFGWARGGSARGFADGGDTTDGIYIPDPPPSQDDSFYERQADELPPENILPGALPVPEQDLQPPGALGQMSPPIPATVQESLPAPQPNRQMVASAEPPISEDPRHVTRGKVDPWLALATAGFATAAGTSPYAGVNIGKGAVAGIENYVEQKKQANTVDEAADKLMTEADQHRKRLAFDQQQADTTAGHYANQDRLGQASLKQKQEYQDAVLKQKDRQIASGILSPENLDFMADQYLAGDKSVVNGLGYGTAGATNRAQLRDAIHQRALDAGMSPAEVTEKMADYQGVLAEHRVISQRIGAVRMGAEAVKGAADLALAASEKVDRAQYPDWNKMTQAVAKGTGDEKIVDFMVKNSTLINEFAAARNPRGIPRLADKEEAANILSTAFSKGQYKTGVNAIRQEIANIQGATKTVHEGKDIAGDKAPAKATTKTSDTIRVKGPDGRIGKIHASELQDALNNGWSKVP